MTLKRVQPKLIGPARRTPHGSVAGSMDTIADGVTLVIQRPQLMLVPLILDAILWLFVHVPLGPLAIQFADFMERSNVEYSAEAASGLRDVADQVMVTDVLGAFVPSMFSGAAVDTVLGMLLAMFAPSEFGVTRQDISENWRDGLVNSPMLSNGSMILLLFFVCVLLAGFAFSAFQVPIARAVRGESVDGMAGEILRTAILFLGYLTILLGSSIFLMVPIAILAAIFMAVGYSAVFIMTFALIIFGTMVSVYTWFAPTVIVLNRAHPLAALQQSVRIGRAHFGQVARFAVLVMLISFAVSFVGRSLVSTPPGLMLALVGSSFVGTSLTAANMLFYSDRYRLQRRGGRDIQCGPRHMKGK